jgi:hypothetical protein
MWLSLKFCCHISSPFRLNPATCSCLSSLPRHPNTTNSLCARQTGVRGKQEVLNDSKLVHFARMLVEIEKPGPCRPETRPEIRPLSSADTGRRARDRIAPADCSHARLLAASPVVLSR